jgi:hypothetical protein
MMSTINFRKSEGLIFGIYPGSGVGLDTGQGIIQGKADVPDKMMAALDDLSGGMPFLVRGYLQYTGGGNFKNRTPADVQHYCRDNIKLDLAICYRTNERDMPEWRKFVKHIIITYKDVLAKIQITEEPNNPDTGSGGDGSSANVKQAIIDGVLAAKEIITALGLDIQIGFNAVISFNPADTFWQDFSTLVTPDFTSALDYIGLDFYPDVFRPLPPGIQLKEAVTGVLHHYRNQNLAQGGISNAIPLHITENGWPTNQSRSEARQATVIQEIIETIFEASDAFNITHYEFFNLRDIDSSGLSAAAQIETSGNNFQFGLLRDDYTPKPAYLVFKHLIRQMS